MAHSLSRADEIRTALEHTAMNDITQWTQTHIGTTLLSQRKTLLSGRKGKMGGRKIVSLLHLMVSQELFKFYG